ncbi:nucleoside triphosphate pyrophosphohydrolase [Paenalkalicoccus suaedae]
MNIHIIGLGAGDLEQLSLGMYKRLKEAKLVRIRTLDHPLVKSLQEEGVAFESYDHLYESTDEFSDVYTQIVDALMDAAKEEGTVTYAVPGHPMVAESTVQKLLAHDDVTVTIEGGQSFLDPMFTALHIDPIDGFQLVDGTAMLADDLVLTQHVIIGQVYDAMSASVVKLALMERLPDDYVVMVVTAAGTKQESIVSVPLFELDRVTTLSNLTAVYVPPVQDARLLYREFRTLREVIKTLRGPNGCPWDKKQTHESLKRYAVEEVYELLEAIDSGDDDHIVEELGDVLLQVMLHAQIGEDDGYYTVEDIIEELVQKMIRRHPHVFGDAAAEDAEEVLANWEQIKMQEKEGEAARESRLDGIPKDLPGLLKAYKLQKKAARVGFDWDDAAPMWMKLQEELSEWLHELKMGNRDKAVSELGDVLFVLVNLARFYEIEPEEAIQRTNTKFATRFRYIEAELHKQGLTMEDQSLDVLDELWEKSKRT